MQSALYDAAHVKILYDISLRLAICYAKLRNTNGYAYNPNASLL